MKHKRTERDDAYDSTLEAQGHRIEAKESLDVFPKIDEHMDMHQERGYALVREVMNELQETHPCHAGKLRQALQCFEQAEILEDLNEVHVSEATNAVNDQESPLDSVVRHLDRTPRMQGVS